MNEKDVFAALRMHGVRDMREVRLAIVEHDGSVSVMPHAWAERVLKADVDDEMAKARKQAFGGRDEPPPEKCSDSPRRPRPRLRAGGLMDLWRIIVRVVFAYVFALAVMRLAGKRTVSRTDVSSCVVLIVIGDMFDDLLWADVPAAQFVVGVGALVLAHVTARLAVFRSGDARVAAGGGRSRNMKTIAQILVTMTLALAIVAVCVFAAGDRQTLVPPPDAVAEAFVRQAAARRYDRVHALQSWVRRRRMTSC